MNYEQIKESAARNKGVNFNEKGFRYTFDLPMTGATKLMNQLIKDGIISKNGKSFTVL